MMRPLNFDPDGNGPEDGHKRRKRIQAVRRRSKSSEARRRNIAILDLETDPFDPDTKATVYPFLAVLYSDQFETVTIWDDDWRGLVSKLFNALEALDEPFTIYAHNGGRFDYMYFMHLIDGRVKFKGRALMSAKLGKHELRDSLHIIPESLKNANRKDTIDYRLLAREHRNSHRKIITDYCISDCVYTFEVVRAFIDKFGMPMTIGQASMAELKKHYQFAKLSEPTDRYFRQWFFGGRVECLNKLGRYTGAYKLYDVNSMYPSVMAFQKHPIGDVFFVGDKITPRTAFIHLRCQNNGAFLSRSTDGQLTASDKRGEFHTTIHEYRTAVELGLISQISIIKTIDFKDWSDFSKFVLPLYERRDELKMLLEIEPNHPDRRNIEQEIKFIKYLLNNAYGKFAQNPRNFKDCFLTPPNEHPPTDWLYNGVDIQASRMRFELEGMDEGERIEHVKQLRSNPEEETDAYWIWTIPSSGWRFNNVATAASITGAARAKLLRAKHSAIEPLYCDTDSLICRDLVGHEINPSKLGSWKLETEISDFIMAGKKLYGYHTPKYDGVTMDPKNPTQLLGETIRTKGLQGVTWQDLEAVIGGAKVRKTMKAPTLTRSQGQHYMVREMRMTGMGVPNGR